MKQVNGVKNRDLVIDKLFEEMIGPSPNGNRLDCSKTIVFNNAKETYQSFRQMDSGDEILQRDAPLNRYGAGILYPVTEQEKERNETEKIDKYKTGKIVFNGRGTENYSDSDADDFEKILSTANQKLPNSMGISFLAEINLKPN